MQNVINQLGGNKFVMMVGAKNIGTTNNTIQFHFMKAPTNKANVCKITLDANDTYSMTFFKAAKFNCDKVGETLTGLYADMLERAFKQQTGLETRL